MGGEKHRVAIARALVNDPDLVLCDETTGNLDSTNSNAVMDLPSHLVVDPESLVVVTHDPKVSARFRRELRMQDGRIIAEEARGSVREEDSASAGEDQSLVADPPEVAG